jgi:hypothetical protein
MATKKTTTGSTRTARTPVSAPKISRASAAGSGPTDSGEELVGRDAVAHRAYELFLARGGQHGHDVEDWLAAERELAKN